MDNVEPIVLGYASQPLNRNNAWGVVKSVLAVTAALFPIGLLITPSFISTRIGAEKSLGCVAVNANGPIVVSIKTFELHTGHLPALLRDLGIKPVGESRWNGPYIEDPTKLIDPWGSQYQYRCPGKNGRAYDLWSMGPDMMNNTEDDITSWPKK